MVENTNRVKPAENVNATCAVGVIFAAKNIISIKLL
jgi:hypothetical protein